MAIAHVIAISSERQKVRRMITLAYEILGELYRQHDLALQAERDAVRALRTARHLKRKAVAK